MSFCLSLSLSPSPSLSLSISLSFYPSLSIYVSLPLPNIKVQMFCTAQWLSYCVWCFIGRKMLHISRQSTILPGNRVSSRPVIWPSRISLQLLYPVSGQLSHVRAHTYRATGLAVDRISGLAEYYCNIYIRCPVRLSHVRAHTYRATGLAVDRITGLVEYHYNCYIWYLAR